MEDTNSPEGATKETKLCPHCQKEISIKAKRCPYCQADLRNWLNRHPFLSFIVVLICGVFLLSLVGSVTNNSTSSENRPDVSTDYASSTSQQASSSQQTTPSVQPNVVTNQPVTDSSNNSDPTPTAQPSSSFVSPTSASFGQETEIYQGVYVIMGHPQDFTSTSPYQQPESGDKFVSVYASFQNNSPHSFDYNSLDISVVDPSGANYIGEAASTESPALNSGTINPGNQATGYVLFEVPASETTSQFTVHGVFGGISGNYEYPTNAVVDFK